MVRVGCLQRTVGLSYGLWRVSAPDYLTWSPLASAVIVTNGSSTVTLTDPNAGATGYFYRIIATSP